MHLTEQSVAWSCQAVVVAAGIDCDANEHFQVREGALGMPGTGGTRGLFTDLELAVTRLQAMFRILRSRFDLCQAGSDKEDHIRVAKGLTQRT